MTLEQVRYGCNRYRKNPENKFFPTPGQLLEASKNPFDNDPPYRRHMPYRDDLPPAMPPEIARALAKTTREKYNFLDATEKLKEEIRNRPPLVQTAQDLALEKALGEERNAALDRGMQ